MRVITGALRTVAVTSLLTVLGVAPPVAGPPLPPAEEQVLGELLPLELLADGVTHREFTTTDAAGRVRGDVIEVDLADPQVRTDLLTPGAVAARSTVAKMADARGAVAAVNGDFFDLGRTSAPAGPAVAGGDPLKAAVPQGRRLAPAVPGAEVDDVFAVGADRRATIDRLTLEATATSRRGAAPVVVVPVVALNQYAIPVGGVGLFTADWGAASRAGSVCGSDTDAAAGCAPDVREVLVSDGVVTAVSPRAGEGQLAPTEVVLLGRDGGAEALRSLQVGDRVQVDYRLVPESGRTPRFAVGGSPILRDGAATERLDDSARAPRSGAAVSPDGRRMYLVTIDGRQAASVGATLAEFAALLHQLGGDDGMNLDGGGSSTLVYRKPGERQVTVVNDPSDSAPRMVPNGIGVFSS
ncbi:MAG: phosphodiester glycosidase family protein [Pseudonocardiaceae bacterium]